jgi:hypothetical protein
LSLIVNGIPLEGSTDQIFSKCLLLDQHEQMKL